MALIVFTLVTLGVPLAQANSDQQSRTLDTPVPGSAQDDGLISRICVLGDESRSIELIRENHSEPAPCLVQQRRRQGLETLWRAENDGKYCVRAYRNYLSRLTSLGFDCGLQIPTSLDRAAAGFDPED